MDHLLELFLIMAVATTYITNVMLLERKTSHFGPFPSTKKFLFFHVDYDDDGAELEMHLQPVTLFDWLRRLFGAYSIKGDTWNVRDGALSEVWTCPKCLSFWMALIPAVALAALTSTWFLIPFYVPALAGISTAVNINLL